MAAAKAMGYEQLPSGGGSARNFYNPNRDPAVVTVHEPHNKGKTLKQGTLSEYLHKFRISRDDFMNLLGGESKADAIAVEVCCICHEDIEPLQATMKHKENGLTVHTECHVRIFGLL